MTMPTMQAGPPQGGPTPDQVKTMLLQMLMKARQIAEANGIKFEELLAMMGNRGVIPPRPGV